jgi:N-acetylglutamate synthase-like GNAT family acetyltransferase
MVADFSDVPLFSNRQENFRMPTEAEVIVRSAQLSDVSFLGQFVHAFVEEGKLLPRTETELEELVPHGFVAEYQGEIVGFVALEVYSAKLAEIRSLAVSQTLQGKGVGKKLVAACVARAHELNVLEVMAITSTEEFFMSCGFDFSLPGEKKALFIHTRDE